MEARPSATDLLDHKWFRTHVSTANKVLVKIFSKSPTTTSSTPSISTTASSTIAKLTSKYLFNTNPSLSPVNTKHEGLTHTQHQHQHQHQQQHQQQQQQPKRLLQVQEQNVWAGQKRLKGFLRHLNDKKTR